VRNLYFLILILILLAMGVSFIYFGQRFFDAREKSLSADIQNNLLAFQLIEVEQKPITLLFVGDIMLSRGVANQIEKHNDPRWPFLKIASTTQAADLIFGNLEGPISSRGKNQGSIYSFRVKPEVVEGLKFSGFDVLSLANNHIWDWGKDALADTVAMLEHSSIESAGAGGNYKEANAPAIKKINGTKIEFLAYTNLYPETLKAKENSAGISDFDLEKIKSKIKELNGSAGSPQAADIIIISLHWGQEYQTHSNLDQQNIAHFLIESGADLIIGHHPHVVQEVEKYLGGWVTYSLGNFIFDQNFSAETMTGLMLKVIVKNKKISEILPVKIKINSAFQPEIIEL
jgi:gamma-polyglutamate biosynthesis protein CapA